MGAEAGDDIVLVNPSEVVEIMKQVPRGKLVTIVEICKEIAKQHNVKGYCSLTTGIFIMTAANAAEEVARDGKSPDIPYWRTLKSGGFLNPKYPDGQEAHKRLLEQEGYNIVQKGKKFPGPGLPGIPSIEKAWQNCVIRKAYYSIKINPHI